MHLLSWIWSVLLPRRIHFVWEINWDSQSRFQHYDHQFYVSFHSFSTKVGPLLCSDLDGCIPVLCLCSTISFVKRPLNHQIMKINMDSSTLTRYNSFLNFVWVIIRSFSYLTLTHHVDLPFTAANFLQTQTCLFAFPTTCIRLILFIVVLTTPRSSGSSPDFSPQKSAENVLSSRYV